MSPGVDLVFLWHHHQPDYRHPRDGRSVLPWVRLHATKDYLDMALRLERHAGLKATFNFVPSLLEQLDHARNGGGDLLFDLLARPPKALGAGERAELQARMRTAPRWAFARWPGYEALCRRLRAPAVATDAELMRLSVYFLLAWLDPLLLSEPAAAAAEAAVTERRAGLSDRDALLALHADVLGRVVPAYRRLAARGQAEISCSPAYHPILPLLVDVRAGRRSRPDLPVPAAELASPEDARWQVERGLERTASAFGVRPAGMWPSEGSVSPEAAAVLAAAGVRWIATDELVLWKSVGPAGARREGLYRPWTFRTEAGEIAIFFRDHDLSDRIGFVYAGWKAADAAADFLRQLRRIGAEHAAAGLRGRPVVSVILDGENCWEHYPGDGGPFLDALYGALESAPDVRTRTPSEVLADGPEPGVLDFLHTGSWIDADLHVWAGHPEKNRAWDLLARARAALVEAGHTREGRPEAWESLAAAEGSDWFWWFGDDHFTADKTLFDSLFRSHLQAIYERAGLPVPNAVLAPIVRPASAAVHAEPAGLIHPVIDGRRTRYYEWDGAGTWEFPAGGSMHRASATLVSGLQYGFDTTHLFLLVEFAGGEAPQDDVAVELELLSPAPGRLRVGLLAPGRRAVERGREGAVEPVGEAAVEDVLEIALPFEALGVPPGGTLELLLHLGRGAERLETLPPGQPLRVVVPGADWEAEHWSV